MRVGATVPTALLNTGAVVVRSDVRTGAELIAPARLFTTGSEVTVVATLFRAAGTAATISVTF